MLKIENLHVAYGGIQALRGISLEVPDGKIVTLIGANGAGKSTMLRTITGLVKAQSGSIQWNGKELLGMSIDQIIGEGIAMSPEGRRVFADLTVLENLKIGAYLRKDKEGIQKDIEWVYSLFPRLQERSWQAAGTLSGGEQQMLAIGRALMSRPKLMMLDEPVPGSGTHLVVQDIFYHHQRDQQPGCDGSAHRAERQHGAENRRSCLCAGDRQHHHERHRSRAVGQRKGQGGLPGQAQGEISQENAKTKARLTTSRAFSLSK